MSVTDQDLLSDIQSLLAEPLDGGATFPSGMWTPAEALDALDHAQQSLLTSTGLVLRRRTITCTPHVLRQTLPDDVIALQRVVWERASDGRIFPLNRGDEWELDAGDSTWRTEPGIPIIYTDADLPTRTLRVAPAASVVGSLHLTYLAVPVAFTGSGVEAEVPDDSTVILVWHTLAELLSKDGRGKDPARAQVAAQRATLGVEAVKLILQGWEA